MTAADYRRAVTRSPADSAPTTGVSADDAPWDPELASAMSSTGAPGFEEALLDLLLDDLRRGLPPA
jgi:hypothetical protein